MEPTLTDPLNDRATPEAVLKRYNEEASRFVNPYKGHILKETEKSTYVHHILPPTDTRTPAERTRALFSPYGGVPGQRG